MTTNQRESRYHEALSFYGLDRGKRSVKQKCNCHNDNTASRVVSRGDDGRILSYCHAGCKTEDTFAADGFDMKDTFPPDQNKDIPKPKPKFEAEYLYSPNSKKIKLRYPDGSKSCFWQHLKGTEWINGRGNEPLTLFSNGIESDTAYIVEGEGDVLTLKSLGLSAYSLPDGAKSKWLPQYADPFKGKTVYFIQDNDKPGRELAQMVAKELQGIAATVKVFDLSEVWPELPEKGDTTDFYKQFGAEETLRTLQALSATTAEWEPKTELELQEVLDQSDEWKAPVSLGDIILPEFPAECLPDAMKEYVLAVSEAMQVSVDMAAVSALVVSAICVQKKLIIKGKPDWFEPLNLYSVIVAPPAERKSALLNAMTKVLFEFERDSNELSKEAIAAYQIRKNILEKTVRELEDKAAKGKGGVSAEDVIETRKELEELQEVKPMRLLADDVSPEALTSLLAEQDGKMAVVSAEGGIFEILNGRYSQSVNIDTFLKAHAGDPVRVDRRGRPSEYIPNPALSVLLAIQPVVLDGLMSNDAFRGRGLTARFLYSIPTSKVGRRAFETPPIPAISEAKYKGMIYGLLAIPQEDKPRIIELSNEAYRLSAVFASELEPRLSGDLETMGDWAGKFHGAILRIAGVLHAAKNPQNCTEIELAEKTMQDAIVIGRYFLEHAKGAYTLMGADQQVQDAKYVLRQLEKQHCDTIARRDLFRMCRGRFKKSEDINPALELLAEYEYLKEIEVEHKGVGRKPDIQFKVNPFLYGQNGLNGQNDPPSSISSNLSNLSTRTA